MFIRTHSVRKSTETTNTAVATLKEELEKEIDELTQIIKRLEDREENASERMMIDGEITVPTGTQLNDCKTFSRKAKCRCIE